MLQSRKDSFLSTPTLILGLPGLRSNVGVGSLMRPLLVASVATSLMKSPGNMTRCLGTGSNVLEDAKTYFLFQFPPNHTTSLWSSAPWCGPGGNCWGLGISLSHPLAPQSQETANSHEGHPRESEPCTFCFPTSDTQGSPWMLSEWTNTWTNLQTAPASLILSFYLPCIWWISPPPSRFLPAAKLVT